MAGQAELEFSVSLAMDAIDLSWSGFNDKLVNFVTESLQKINSFRYMESQEIFDQVKEQLSQEYKNYYLNQVFRMAMSDLDRCLISNNSDIKTLKSHLESLDYDTFKAMQAQWLKRGCMMWYACGNLGKETSKQIVE